MLQRPGSQLADKSLYRFSELLAGHASLLGKRWCYCLLYAEPVQGKSPQEATQTKEEAIDSRWCPLIQTKDQREQKKSDRRVKHVVALET